MARAWPDPASREAARADSMRPTLRLCPRVSTCPLLAQASSASLLPMWRNYCEADFQGCVRYQRGQAGRPIPDEMLPNGELWSGP